MSRRRLLGGVSVLVLLIVVLLVARSRPAPDVEPSLVLSDSLPDPGAIGMCAMNRASGAVEGRIEGISSDAGGDRQRFRVRSLRNPEAVYVMEPALVQVVRCESPSVNGSARP